MNTQIHTPNDIKPKLIGFDVKVTTYAEIKFNAFATQKNIEDTRTEEPKYDSYIKLNDTNDEKPALNKITETIKANLSCNNS